MKRVNLEQETDSKLHVENLTNIFFKLFAIGLIAITIYLWNSYFLNAQDAQDENIASKAPEILEKVTSTNTENLEEDQVQTLEEIQESLEQDNPITELPSIEPEIASSDQEANPEVKEEQVVDQTQEESKDEQVATPEVKTTKEEEKVDNKVQTIEEITKELAMEKAKNEPQIDIESLGLDLIEEEEKKDEEPKVAEADKEPAPLPNVAVKEEVQNEEIQAKTESGKEEVNEVAKQEDAKKEIANKEISQKSQAKKEEEEKGGILSNPLKRIQKLLSDKVASQPDEEENTEQASDGKSETELQTVEVIKEPEVDKKLEELRKVYLKQDNEEQNLKANVPTPVKRHFSSYTKNQMAPLPIMSRYRTNDNVHIPTYPTTSKKIQNLFDTIKSGDVSAFNNAYQSIKNPNVTNRFGDSTITASILMQQHAILASSLAQGSDPNKPNGLNYTPMEMAIELLDFTSVKLLVKNGADLNYTDAFGRTYLMKAAKNGFLPAIEILTEKGTDINAMDKDGFTALSIAHRHKNDLVVKFLIKNGAKIWSKKPFKPEKYFLIKELQNRWQ